MGLGKTVQTISFLATIKSKGASGPNLIVTPAAFSAQWFKAIGDWVDANIFKMIFYQGDGRFVKP
ncbi:hypothetical protein GJ744_011114 [Endocarpon pusillum]|uniref:SNF2 N-terminal domain-containing protein n=1 Tax=Endocarpon pusillum TaxID=364733 RepID=A0A8H7E3P6_9EURO|nr:hypothetical protein GJ744_011114 [Endocarpon pusillum]